MFRLGHYTQLGFTTTVPDFALVPAALDVQASQDVQGGTFRGLNGTATIDRIGRKRTWSLSSVSWLAQSQWWPIIKQWEQWKGPWSWFDGTRPNLLPQASALMNGITNAAGSANAATIDGRVSLASGQVAQLGADSPGLAGMGILAPVVPGTTYILAVNVFGQSPTLWSLVSKLRWFKSDGTFISQVSGTARTQANCPTTPFFDGSLAGSRVVDYINFVAPALAAYAMPSFTVTGTNTMLQDLMILEGPLASNDPGGAWYEVEITKLDATYHRRGYATLALDLKEI